MERETLTRKGLKEELERAREEFLKKCREMAEVKEFLNNILESMEDGVFTVDRDGRITSFNRAATQITGYMPEEVIGERCKEIFRSLLCKTNCSLKEVLKTGRIVHNYDIKIFNKANKKVSVNVITSPLRDSRGEIIGAIEVFRDITPFKELQTRLAQSEKFTLMGELAAGIAHEINNPINGVLTYIKLLLKKLSKSEVPETLTREMKRYLITMERETTRVGKLVKNLLDFSRQTEPEVKPIDMSKVLNQSLLLLQDQLRVGGIEVYKEIASPLPRVMADFGQLQQVFMNIIVNAAQAMPKGGELRIRIFKDEEWVRAELEDTGCGIPQKNIPKLFDPFFTTKCGNNKCLGLGLGLSIVKRIIDAHHGLIEVKSKVGKGSTFIIKLPIADASGIPQNELHS